VIADGFYEWQKLGNGRATLKQPVYIRMKSGAPFVFGGLWDRWNGLESFSIVTVEPNELVSSIHDRMPLIVPEDNFARWLRTESPVEDLPSMLKPYPAEEMESYPVRSQVNSPDIDTPDCVEPLPAEFKLMSQGELKI
jgi:putative SOS response-associated peptidase YedK